MNTAIANVTDTEPKARVYHVKEYRLVALRETLERDNPTATTPEEVCAYWNKHVVSSPQFRTDVETMWVLFLNTRRRVKGHMMLSTGTLDELLVHPREVFRPAIVANSAAIILIHIHPSGDPTPSEADIKVTRDLIRAGQLIKIEVLDHLVMGQATADGGKKYASLRELGYFCN